MNFWEDPRAGEAVLAANRVHDDYIVKFPYDPTSAHHLARHELETRLQPLYDEGLIPNDTLIHLRGTTCSLFPSQAVTLDRERSDG